MTDPNWDRGEEVVVRAVPTHGNWTRALEYVDAAKRLKFVVDDKRKPQPVPPPDSGGSPQPVDQQKTGDKPKSEEKLKTEEKPKTEEKSEDNKWSYAEGKECGADGDPRAPVNPANSLLPDAPPGSLIAKIGGSPAGKTSDGLKSFVVGSFCIIDIDNNSKGTLYLTMNADPMGLLERKGYLCVKVYRSV
jgi:hypothetical protein